VRRIYEYWAREEERKLQVVYISYWSTKGLKHCSISSFCIFIPKKSPLSHHPTHLTSAVALGMFICHSLSTEASWECDKGRAICLQNFDIVEWSGGGMQLKQCCR